jgi:multisubunit Na+/H+ antiporter MnhB subunit
VILILGPLFFAIRGLWLNMPWLNLPTAAEVYAAIIRGVEWSGDQLLKTQGGKLRYYLTSIMGVVSIIMLFGGYDALQPLSINIDSSADIVKIMLLALAIGATIAAIVSRRHLLAALAMGVMGYAIGGIFLLEPAPDVALVQFLVETLATVLIILMIGRISTEQRQEAMSRLWQGKRGRWGIARDAAISTLIGVSVGVFALTAIQDRDLRMAIAISVEEEAIEEQITANGNGEEAEEIAEGLLALPDQAMPAQWYLDNAYPETRATDVVASVLADFRATDTLLEITVFAIAAIGVLTLLTLPGADDLMRGQPLREVAASLAKQRQPKVSRQAEVTAPIVEQSAVSEVKTDESGQIIVPQGTADPNGAPLVKQGDGHTGSEDELEAALNLDTYGTWSQEHDVPRLSTPLTRNVASLVLPFALVISFTHVLYGGGGPGDGFTAGMVSGLAVALWYVVFGYFEARQRLSWLHPGRLITAGLIIALVNAIAGMVLADGFFNLYMLGDGDGPAGLKFVSSVIFELAIFLTVFGGATVIMEAIAHPREVETET